MTSIYCVRRHWLLGAATTGLALIAPAAFADDRQAAPAKKADAETVPVAASERLMRDNALTLRVLLLYAAAGRRLGQGEDLESGIFTQSAEVMRDFVHGYHEKVEEENIFPIFKKAGRMVDLVTVFQSQHTAGRQLTDKILAAAPGIANSDQRKALTDALHATVTLYQPCIARENTDLLPSLRSLMTPSEFEALGQTLEKAEGQMLGADGFEKAAKKVEAIEKKLGTHDLSQFTPKT
jgi:hemerythrin-like domain-containing protein